jgi:hypothetical protein
VHEKYDFSVGFRGSTFPSFILFGSFSKKKVQLWRKVGPWVGLEFNLGSLTLFLSGSTSIADRVI